MSFHAMTVLALVSGALVFSVAVYHATQWFPNKRTTVGILALLFLALGCTLSALSGGVIWLLLGYIAAPSTTIAWLFIGAIWLAAAFTDEFFRFQIQHH